MFHMKNKCLHFFFMGWCLVACLQLSQAQDDQLRQKQEHSKLYNGYGNGRSLRALAATAKGDFGVVRIEDGGEDPKVRLSPMQFVQNLACRADVVALAVVTSRSSSLAEDESFIFTDYQVTVEEVLKADPQLGLSTASSMVITRPGGILAIEGRVVIASNRSFEPLEPGKRYLFFLSFLPNTGTYRALDHNSTYVIDEGVVLQLKRVREAHSEYPLAEFLGAVLAGCK